MNRAMDIKTKDNNRFAAYLLYAVSVVGILDFFFSASAMSAASVLPRLDIAAYGVMFVLAFFVHRGSRIGRVAYAIAAIVWFIALTCYLPWKFAHPLNVVTVFSQLCMIATAYAILLTSKKRVSEVSH